ncbi:MAG: hypothetical protein Q8L07_15360 [Sediminibacterium sp.]|nr:hypothetical protein [Sediminibacterium sp.]
MKRLLIIILMIGWSSVSFGQSKEQSTSVKNKPDTLPKDKDRQKRFIIYSGNHVGIEGGGKYANMKNAKALSKKENSWDDVTNGQKRIHVQSGTNVGLGVKNHSKEDTRVAWLLNAGKPLSAASDNAKDSIRRFFIPSGKHVGVGSKRQ